MLEMFRPSIYPIEDSVPFFQAKLRLAPDCPENSMALAFTIAVRRALFLEDSPADRQEQRVRELFPEDLPAARANAAVFYEAFTDYCIARGSDPKTTLINWGMEKTEIEKLLKYGSSMFELISKAADAEKAACTPPSLVFGPSLSLPLTSSPVGAEERT